VPVELSDYARMHEDVTVIMTGELASTQEANLDRFELFDIGVQVRIARRLVPSATDYLRSLRRRVLAQRAAVQAFDNAGVDHLLTDTTAARLSDVTVEVNEVRHPMQSMWAEQQDSENAGFGGALAPGERPRRMKTLLSAARAADLPAIVTLRARRSRSRRLAR
jgi:hypothetical protein